MAEIRQRFLLLIVLAFAMSLAQPARAERSWLEWFNGTMFTFNQSVSGALDGIAGQLPPGSSQIGRGVQNLASTWAAGNSATCKSCAHCPWMAMNGLRNLAEVLESGANEVHVEPSIGLQARRSIDRMLDFAAARRARALPTGKLENNAPMFAGVGPA